MASSYTAKDILVLEGLEPVRRRPGMYIGGVEWEQTFSRGKPASALKKVGPARGSGTSVFFRPDPKIFPDVRFDPKRIAELLEAKAYLHGGLTVEFHDEHAGTKAVYHYED